MPPSSVPETPAPEPAANDRAIRVFVSSTFRDMGGERDELVKRIFPALRKLCESRGVTWGEVDLRWGDHRRTEGRRPGAAPLPGRDRPLPALLHRAARRALRLGADAFDAGSDRAGALALGACRPSVTELEILHGVLRRPRYGRPRLLLPPRPGLREGKPPDQFREVRDARGDRLAREQRWPHGEPPSDGPSSPP